MSYLFVDFRASALICCQTMIIKTSTTIHTLYPTLVVEVRIILIPVPRDPFCALADNRQWANQSTMRMRFRSSLFSPRLIPTPPCAADRCFPISTTPRKFWLSQRTQGREGPRHTSLGGVKAWQVQNQAKLWMINRPCKPSRSGGNVQKHSVCHALLYVVALYHVCWFAIM